MVSFAKLTDSHSLYHNVWTEQAITSHELALAFRDLRKCKDSLEDVLGDLKRLKKEKKRAIGLEFAQTRYGGLDKEKLAVIKKKRDGLKPKRDYLLKEMRFLEAQVEEIQALHEYGKEQLNRRKSSSAAFMSKYLQENPDPHVVLNLSTPSDARMLRSMYEWTPNDLKWRAAPGLTWVQRRHLRIAAFDLPNGVP